MKLDPHGAGLYPVLDPAWRDRLLRAGWLVFVPCVGWLLVLGYRRALIEHFFQRRERALPEWEGRQAEHGRNGVRAVLVVHGYLLPAWIALFVLLAQRGFEPGLGTVGLALACLFAPLLTNLVFPLACLLLSLPVRGEPVLSVGELLALKALFASATFLLPAAFLRVSATGSFRAAFDLRRTVDFVLRRFSDYLGAWWYALWMNVAGILLLPVRPWMLFWGYVASAALFNQLLFEESTEEGVDRPREDGWLRAASHRSLDVANVRVWRTPWFSAPLP